MVKKCPLCNRTSDEVEFYGEFCRYCRQEKLRMKLPNLIQLTKCNRCQKVLAKGHFVKATTSNLELALSQVLKGYTIKLIGEDEKEKTITIEVTEETPEYTITGEKVFGLKIQKTICETCNKRAGSYYEGVIQLRGENTEKMERFIEKINKYMEERNEFIPNVKTADNGFDVYVSNKRMTAAYLTSRHIKFIPSYTLYGLKNGRNIYRHTYSVRV